MAVEKGLASVAEALRRRELDSRAQTIVETLRFETQQDRGRYPARVSERRRSRAPSTAIIQCPAPKYRRPRSAGSQSVPGTSSSSFKLFNARRPSTVVAPARLPSPAESDTDGAVLISKAALLPSVSARYRSAGWGHLSKLQ
jgi:hypothetical protein